MKNMNREVTEEKHNLCPSWKPPHNLKVGIGDINTFSVKTKGSCKNNHTLYKPEFKEDVSFCCLCQGKSTSTLSSGQRSPAHFTDWGWWGLEEGGGSGQLQTRWKKTQHVRHPHSEM